MPPYKLEKLGLNYTPTSVITSEHVNKTYEGIKTTTPHEDIENSWDEKSKTMWLLIYILSFFACVLAVIVLYKI